MGADVAVCPVAADGVPTFAEGGFVGDFEAGDFEALYIFIPNTVKIITTKMQQPNVKRAGHTFSFSESELSPKKRFILSVNVSSFVFDVLSLLFFALAALPEAFAPSFAAALLPLAAEAAAIPAATGATAFS